MGLAPSRFRYDDQEPRMRTVANENEYKMVAQTIQTPNLWIENKVSTKENRVDMPEANPPNFTIRKSIFWSRFGTLGWHIGAVIAEVSYVQFQI